MTIYLFKQVQVTGITESDLLRTLPVGTTIDSITVGGHDTITIDTTLTAEGEVDLFEFMGEQGYEYKATNPLDRNTTLFEALIPLANVTDAAFPFMGDFQSIATGLSADYLTVTSGRNNHIYLSVTSITTGGDITITGTSTNEFTGVPADGDTETIAVDDTGGQFYKTDKKWLQVDSVTLSGVVGITYDFGTINYYEGFGQDFRIVGWRGDIRSQGNNGDIRVRMRKIKNLGSGKFEFETIEDIGYDSTNTNGSQVDNLRVGVGIDRTKVLSAQMMPNNRQFTFEQLDFDFYHAISGANRIHGSEHEGVLIDFLGQGDAGISNVDNILFTMITQNG